IHKCFIHDTQLASFKGSQSKGVYIIGNELARAGVGRQNVEFVAVDDVVIAGNEAHHSGLFDEIKGGAINGIIYRNYVHDSAGGILVGGDCTGRVYLVNTTATWEAKNLKVWDNVIANDSDEAFRIVDCQDCVVSNNTFYAKTPKAMIRMLTEGFDGGDGKCNAVKLGNKNVRLTNNVFVMDAKPTYGIATNETAGATVLSLDHNAWFVASGDVTTVGSDVPFKGEATSLYVDPKLVGPQPGAGSPLLGKGTPIDFVKGNAEGKCWSPPNIGAY
ncbi:MAG: right-handed parallel beta-helix repeat-containing protein, partial [Polyangiales bacterium]